MTVHYSIQCSAASQYHISFNSMIVAFGIAINLKTIGTLSDQGKFPGEIGSATDREGHSIVPWGPPPPGISGDHPGYAVMAGIYGHEQEHVGRITMSLRSLYQNWIDRYSKQPFGTEKSARIGLPDIEGDVLNAIRTGGKHDPSPRGRFQIGSEMNPQGVVPWSPASPIPPWMQDILTAAHALGEKNGTDNVSEMKINKRLIITVVDDSK